MTETLTFTASTERAPAFTPAESVLDIQIARARDVGNRLGWLRDEVHTLAIAHGIDPVPFAPDLGEWTCATKNLRLAQVLTRQQRLVSDLERLLDRLKPRLSPSFQGPA